MQLQLAIGKDVIQYTDQIKSVVAKKEERDDSERLDK